MNKIIGIAALLLLCALSTAQPRINIKYQIQKCMDGTTPVQNCCIITDALGQQTYVPCDTLMLQEVYADGDSLCFVFFDTLCVDGVIGGSFADKNFFQDNIAGDGSDHTHNQRGDAITIDSIGSWIMDRTTGVGQYTLTFDAAGFQVITDDGAGVSILNITNGISYIESNGSSGDQVYFLAGGTNAQIYATDGSDFTEGFFGADAIRLRNTNSDYKLGDGTGGDLPPSGALTDSIATIRPSDGRIRMIHPDRLGGGGDETINIGDEDQVPYVEELGTDLEYDDNFKFVGDTSLEISNQLVVNGVDIEPTIFKVTKSGAIEQNQVVNDEAVWVTRILHPLQQDEDNLDWYESQRTTLFDGDRMTSSYYEGYNILGGQPVKPGRGGMASVFEIDYTAGDGSDLNEWHIFWYDSTDTQHRPISIIMDREDILNRYAYFKLSRFFLMDQRNQNQYFQTELTGDTSQVIMSLFSPRSGGTKGVQFFYDEGTFNSLQLDPFGTSNTSLDIGFPYTLMQGVRYTVENETPDFLVTKSTNGWLNKVTWTVAADSVDNHLSIMDHDWHEAGGTPPNNIADDKYSLGTIHIGDATMSGGGILNVVGRIDQRFPTISLGNVAIGTDAGDLSQSGADNVTIGAGAGSALTNGVGNMAMGALALSSGTTASNNIAIGRSALLAGTGNSSIGIGYRALLNATTGPNVAIGHESMLDMVGGSDNVAVGISSFSNATAGTNNTFIGPYAGWNTGANISSNVAIGYAAGAILNGSGNVLIGSEAGATFTGSNKLYIDNSNSSDPLLEGDFSADSLRINGKLKYTTDGSDVISVVGKDASGFLTSMTFEELADSLAAISPTDSVISMGDLICIVTSDMDTVCGDTAFYDQDLGIFCVVDEGDTTCVEFTPAGVTYYTGNSFLSSDRLVEMAGHYSWWRNGSSSQFQIDPDAGNPTIQAWNKPNDTDATLRLNGTGSFDTWMHFNGATAAGFKRDYQIGLDRDLAALRFGKGNSTFSEFWLTYIGDADSLRFEVESTIFQAADETNVLKYRTSAGSDESIWQYYEFGGQQGIFNYREDGVSAIDYQTTWGGIRPIADDEIGITQYYNGEWGSSEFVTMINGGLSLPQALAIEDPTTADTLKQDQFTFIAYGAGGDVVLPEIDNSFGDFKAIAGTLYTITNSTTGTLTVHPFGTDQINTVNASINIDTAKSVMFIAQFTTDGFNWGTIGLHEGTGGGALTVEWDDILSPSGSQSLTFDDAELNAWTVNSNTETFHTITANSLTTGKLLSMTSTSLTSGRFIDIVSNGTAAADDQRGVSIQMTGNNATASRTTYGLYVENTHGGTTPFNYAGQFISSGTGAGVWAQNLSTGYGLHALTSTGTGAFITTTNTAGLALSVLGQVTSGSVAEVARLGSTGTGTNGTGTMATFYAPTTTQSSAFLGNISGLWTDATNATRTSALDFYTVNSASSARRMRIAGDGQLTLDAYVPGAFSGASTDSIATISATGVVRQRHAGLFAGGADGGILSLNGLTGTTQTFATGTSGTAFNISSASTTHTFNLPVASATTVTGINNYAVLAVGHPAESFTNSTTSEQDYTTIYTIPANYLTENKLLRVTLNFQAISGVSSATVLPYIEVGGTKILTTSAIDATNSITRSTLFQFVIQGTAAAGAAANVETALQQGGITAVTSNSITQPVALATNGTLAIVPGIQYSATGSTETMVLRTFFIEQLN